MYEHIFEKNGGLCVKYRCYARVVATTLDIHSPLFSRVDCVSKQFRLPL